MKFSIVIPTYNTGRFISECLDSVLSQSYANWECLVIDDVSNDYTGALVKSYSAKDPRITYHRLAVRGGPSIARNYALTRITGDYILFLDADDLIAPQKLQQAVEVFSDSPVDFVFTDYAIFKEDPAMLTETRCFLDDFSPGLIQAKEIKNKLVYENIFTISCIISRAEYLKELGFFDALMNYNEDWDLWLRSSFRNAVYYYDPRQEGITLIRNHGTSQSKDKTGMYISGIYVCKKNYDNLDSVQKKIMDKKIRYHRNVLKTILMNQYYEDHERFIQTLQRLDLMPYLEDELRSFRKPNWNMPKIWRGVYKKYLHLTYWIAGKCL